MFGINLPVEKGWGRFSLTHQNSAGRFIIVASFCGVVFSDLLSTMFGRIYKPVMSGISVEYIAYMTVSSVKS